MNELVSNIEFWKVLTNLAWPIVALVAFLCLFKHVKPLFQRENLTIEVAGMKINVTDATKSLGKDVADLQQKIAEMEKRIKIPAFENSEKSDDKSSRILSKPKQKKILWVDDYPSNNAFLIEKMRDIGIDVQLSLSTDEAERQLKAADFDLIITDLGRNERGEEKPFAGLELVQLVRKSDQSTPIIVFAGQRGIQNRERLIAAGATSVTNSGADVLKLVEGFYPLG